jgi:transcriptional regulator with XRE-family HTH domain
LRQLREQLGFTLRDVEAAALRISTRHNTDEFAIPLSRLSEIETKEVTPSIFRLYTLSVVYRRDIREILSWYGIDVNLTADDLGLAAPPKSHTSTAPQSQTLVNIPITLDPGFNSRRTTNLSRMIQQWGLVPLGYLQQFLPDNYTYGYVGSEDLTMYPLIMPGTFVQIDEKKSRLEEGPWRSEYERPVYFVETRDGFFCSWCTRSDDKLILQSHPLSNVPPRSFLYSQEAEIIGQVVGMAMRLGEWKPRPESVPVRATQKELG